MTVLCHVAWDQSAWRHALVAQRSLRVEGSALGVLRGRHVAGLLASGFPAAGVVPFEQGDPRYVLSVLTAQTLPWDPGYNVVGERVDANNDQVCRLLSRSCWSGVGSRCRSRKRRCVASIPGRSWPPPRMAATAFRGVVGTLLLNQALGGGMRSRLSPAAHERRVVHTMQSCTWEVGVRTRRTTWQNSDAFGTRPL